MELLALFAFGTVWFWVMFIVASLILISAIENEKGWLATLTIVGTMLLLHFGNDKQLFPYLANHPLVTGGCVLGYFIVGALWGVIKWWFFVRNERAKYDLAFAKFQKRPKKKATTDFEKERDSWNYWVSHGRYDDISFEYKPEPSRFKGRILIWMTYWPWSMLWTVINDPVRKAFKAIYYRIASGLEKISANSFAGTENDIKEEK